MRVGLLFVGVVLAVFAGCDAPNRESAAAVEALTARLAALERAQAELLKKYTALQQGLEPLERSLSQFQSLPVDSSGPVQSHTHETPRDTVQKADEPPQESSATDKEIGSENCGRAPLGDVGFANVTDQPLTVYLFFSGGSSRHETVVLQRGETKFVRAFPEGRHRYEVTYREMIGSGRERLHAQGEVTVKSCVTTTVDLS